MGFFHYYILYYIIPPVKNLQEDNELLTMFIVEICRNNRLNSHNFPLWLGKGLQYNNNSYITNPSPHKLFLFISSFACLSHV